MTSKCKELKANELKSQIKLDSILQSYAAYTECNVDQVFIYFGVCLYILGRVF